MPPTCLQTLDILFTGRISQSYCRDFFSGSFSGLKRLSLSQHESEMLWTIPPRPQASAIAPLLQRLVQTGRYQRLRLESLGLARFDMKGGPDASQSLVDLSMLTELRFHMVDGAKEILQNFGRMLKQQHRAQHCATCMPLTLTPTAWTICWTVRKLSPSSALQ